MIHNKQRIEILGRSLAIIEASVDIKGYPEDSIFKIKSNFLLTNEYQNLIIVPVIGLSIAS